jgi:uncharacterized protein
VTIIVTLIFISSIAAVFYTYQSKKVKPLNVWLLKIGLGILLPLASSLIGLFKRSKQDIRSFYISLNNIIVQAENIKHHPSKILVLVPHCLQFSECGHKITNDIANCKRCGRCCIGEISEIAEELGVFTAVATGGTSARNIVLNRKPKIILSVACERDLASGITEVGNIPVIGLINERPNGPCYNTFINTNVFKENLESFIEKEK